MTEIEWRRAVDASLLAISERLQQLETGDAVDHVLRDSIDRRLTDIEVILKRLNWLIVGSVIAAIMAFVLKGGMQ